MGFNTFKDMIIGYSGKTTPVDEVTEATPLFQTSMWEPTNNGFTHKYQELSKIISADAVNLNDIYPTVGADFNLKDRDIAFFAGTREVHVNTVDQMANGNLESYLQDELPMIYQGTLQNVSFDFYYNVIRPFAKAKGKLVSATASPSGNKYSSIYFVRWQKGQMTGLVNDKWAGSKGGVFTATKLNGGSRYKNADNKSVYGVDIEMPLGFLPANGRNVSGVVNIDLSTILDEDLGRLITNALVQSRVGSGGTTVAYAAPTLVARIAQLKEAQTLGTADNGLLSTMLNGVQIIADWNLLDGTEAPYSV